MELTGALSNPVHGDKNLLNRLSALREELLQAEIFPEKRPPAALNAARVHRVRKAVDEVVSRSDKPLRVRDICEAN